MQIYQTGRIQSSSYLDILGYSLDLIPLTVYPVVKQRGKLENEMKWCLKSKV